MRALLTQLWLRLRTVMRRRRLDRDLDEELAFHLAMKEADLARAGVDDARNAARRRFGNAARLREEVRTMWTFPLAESLAGDLRIAARRLVHDRSFTIVAAGALALGIAVNGTFFAMVYAICLRGVPIDDPERVLVVGSRDADDRPGGLSYPEFVDLRLATTSFDHLAAMAVAPMTIGDPDRAPDRVGGAYVSAEAFDVLRVAPAAGRTLRPEDDRPGAPRVGLLSGGVWQTRYGGESSVIGRTVAVNGRPVTIVGIMPDGFRFPGTADLWLPLGQSERVVAQPRQTRTLTVFGRLKDGVTPPMVEAEQATIRAGWERDLSDAGRGIRPRVATINDYYNPSVTDRAWLAFITAGVLVLLIASANVANLLLMRGVSRGREMALRTAIGGTRRRIVRQLLVEGLVLAGVATVLGLVLSVAGLRILTTMPPADALPYWMTFTLDYRVVAFLSAVSVTTALVFGLAPALHVSHVDPGRELAAGGRSGTRDVSARRWMSVFLAAECALTLVLLAAVAEGARQNLAASRDEFPIEGNRLLTMSLTLPAASYATPGARAAFYARLEERFGGLGSGSAAALTSALPSGGGNTQEVDVRSQPRHAGERARTAVTVAVGERYFDVLGIPMRGRGFDAAEAGADTAVVNERFVQLFLRDRDPLGEHLRLGGAADAAWLRIAGIVPTVRQGPGIDADPVVYLPLRTVAPPSAAVVAGTTGDPVALAAPLRQAVAELDANLPLYRVMTLERAVQDARWNARVSNAIINSIALIAALLALVGLYAVTGHGVSQRRRELGVLAALGASPRHLQWTVLRPALRQLAAGLVLGLGATFVFDRSFGDSGPSTMLDPVTIVPLIGAVVVVALTACLIPTRRAAHADPMHALRAE